ncbi:MAG: prolipoprotein diacylglyceryl transferase [Candidatus Poribacteria bacterium]|nr:prolipoprotein diacylglyceryl transferase [Candidatus Poribacteria bacterium]
MYPTIIDLGSIPIGPINIPLAIHSYGLMLAAAFLTVMFVTQRELARKQLDPQLASSVVFASAIGGIIGAKLYAAFEDGSFSVNELFSTSGLVWYGGMMGGTAAAFFVLHRSRSPVLPVLDAFAPLFLLGYGIGRIGCFLAGDGDYGKASDLPWAMAFPNGTVPTHERVHPTPLYETGMSVIGFGLLWSLRKKKEMTPGWMTGGYLILAGFERFLAEFWRINSPAFLGLTTAQFLSLVLVGIGGWLIYWVTHRPVADEAENIPTPNPPRRKRPRRRA